MTTQQIGMNDIAVKLQSCMDRYTEKHVIEEERKQFAETLQGKIGVRDSEIEGYEEEEKQRIQSVQYTWGHNHNFGSFSLKGNMGDRHIFILSAFMAGLGLPENLEGKKILDVGVWTGGTSLLLAALGAEVHAIEEVKKYTNTVNYLAKAFGIEDRLSCRAISLYDLDDHDMYDYVIYSGVIYHVTDPILSLRILFNSLKDGGKLFLETFGVQSTPDMPYPSFAAVEGPDNIRAGGTGWNYFIPNELATRRWITSVGFSDVMTGYYGTGSVHRIVGAATRERHIDMLRAGLSRPSIR